ncbi:unnamed protein product [Cylicocyclus nassatus]|uniref:Uncharacterized protein n=1 Tax=Cylicocyclus nassatus TaxID=53992 RepID=A0AA36HEX8_CYLNA|nr:unnamed protein product [Cylicocyclus nassatus]
MKDRADAELLQEQHRARRELEKAKMKLAPSVWPTAIAAIIAIFSCLAFSIFFHRGLSGFSKQINAFISIGELASFWLQALLFLITASVIIYLFFAYLASARVFSNALRLCGSPCLLFFSSFTSQGFLLLWVIVTCFIFSMFLIYFLFIGGIYSFCALVDQQCFDFKVLIPAIVNRFSNKKMDMTFCAEKKEILCSKNNNQVWNFFLAFILALVTLGAMLFLQNAVVYGLGKRQAAKERRQRERHEQKERYEMKAIS